MLRRYLVSVNTKNETHPKLKGSIKEHWKADEIRLTTYVEKTACIKVGIILELT